MALTCFCDDGDDHPWYYYPPNNYSVLDTKKSKRCESCNKRIPVASIVGKYVCYRNTRTLIEEKIYGDEKRLAPKYLCEECQDIYYSLQELGFCVCLDDNMFDLLKEYRENYSKSEL